MMPVTIVSSAVESKDTVNSSPLKVMSRSILAHMVKSTACVPNGSNFLALLKCDLLVSSHLLALLQDNQVKVAVLCLQPERSGLHVHCMLLEYLYGLLPWP